MINNIINFVTKNWKIIAIIAVVAYVVKQKNKEHFEEVDVIRAGCKGKAPLDDYISSLGDRKQSNRTNMKPIVDINMNYANIG